MTSIEVVEVLLCFEGNVAWKSKSRALGPRGPSPPTTTNDTALSPAEFQNRCSIEFREVPLSSGGLGFVRSLCGLCADFVWIFCLPHKPPAQASAQASRTSSCTSLRTNLRTSLRTNSPAQANAQAPAQASAQAT